MQQESQVYLPRRQSFLVFFLRSNIDQFGDFIGRILGVLYNLLRITGNLTFFYPPILETFLFIVSLILAGKV